jgi:hypothetical protein
MDPETPRLGDLVVMVFGEDADRRWHVKQWTTSPPHPDAPSLKVDVAREAAFEWARAAARGTSILVWFIDVTGQYAIDGRPKSKDS